MKRAAWFVAFTAAGIAALGALIMWVDAERARRLDEDCPRLQRLAARLSLTDLSLWTEARYLRHPSQTDLFSPFQDFPAAPEHFPAGSIVAPPPSLGRPAGPPSR